MKEMLLLEWLTGLRGASCCCRCCVPLLRMDSPAAVVAGEDDEWYNSRKKKNKVMFQIFEQVMAEFIIFGLVSLLSLWGEIYIAEFCMSAKTESAMPPYHIKKDHVDDKNVPMYSKFITRIFDASAACSSCPNGKVPHVSLLIVFLALFRVLCSFLTIALAKVKIKGWKEWENETLSPSFNFSSE